MDILFSGKRQGHSEFIGYLCEEEPLLVEASAEQASTIASAESWVENYWKFMDFFLTYSVE